MISSHSVSRAAITELTEHLAREVRCHGVTVFSVYPGPLPAGMSDRPGLDFLLRVATGDVDGLSGSHLSVHDALDAQPAQAPETRSGGSSVVCTVRPHVPPAKRLAGDAPSDPDDGGAAPPADRTGLPRTTWAGRLVSGSGSWGARDRRRTSAEGPLDRAA